MTSFGNVESKHVFAARAVQMGIDQPIIDALVARNLATFGQFAYCSSYQTGQPDETPFVEKMVSVLGRNVLDGELSALRRLLFEAQAVSLQDMRNRLEKPSDPTPTRVMPAERAARFDDQVRRLPGLRLAGPLEPSDQLIDAVFALVENNSLKYLPLHKLTSREQELNGEVEDSALKEYSVNVSKGGLSVTQLTEPHRADVSTDLKLRFALQRRALAFDQAGLITFSLHDDWTSMLFHRMSEPAMPNYLQVSIDQALRADRRIFVKMAADCRANIVPIPGNARPLDVSMKRLMDHNDVLYLLSPLADHRRAPQIHHDSGKGAGKLDKQSKKQKAKAKAAAASPYGGKDRGKGHGAAAKGKGKGPPPGCEAKTDDGRFVCWGFNRPGGCSNAAIIPGNSCPRGYHLCGRRGCNGLHPSYDCPSHLS